VLEGRRSARRRVLVPMEKGTRRFREDECQSVSGCLVSLVRGPCSQDLRRALPRGRRVFALAKSSWRCRAGFAVWSARQEVGGPPRQVRTCMRPRRGRREAQPWGRACSASERCHTARVVRVILPDDQRQRGRSGLLEGRQTASAGRGQNVLKRGAAPQKRPEHGPQAVGECQRVARPELLQDAPQNAEEWDRPPGELRCDVHGALQGGKERGDQRGRALERLHGCRAGACPILRGVAVRGKVFLFALHPPLPECGT